LDLSFWPVTMRNIHDMVQNGPAPTLSQGELLQATQVLSQTMGTTGYPPEYVRPHPHPVGGKGQAHPTLAEAFEGLARALAAYRRTGSLPADAVLDAALAVSQTITDRIPS
jgi:hypothetical protein